MLTSTGAALNWGDVDENTAVDQIAAAALAPDSSAADPAVEALAQDVGNVEIQSADPASPAQEEEKDEEEPAAASAADNQEAQAAQVRRKFQGKFGLALRTRMPVMDVSLGVIRFRSFCC